jgi:uncharacterized protein YjbI with pentapeptide repeats
MDIADIKEVLSVRNADLSGSSFQDANMAGVQFRDINLSGAVFDDINLQNASFHNINFAGAKLTLCDTTDMSIDGIAVSDLMRTYQERNSA